MRSHYPPPRPCGNSALSGRLSSTLTTCIHETASIKPVSNHNSHSMFSLSLAGAAIKLQCRYGKTIKQGCVSFVFGGFSTTPALVVPDSGE